MRKKTDLPRILKIFRIEGFKVVCKFNTGEYRMIDFERLFKEWDVQEGDIEYPLLNLEEFQKLEVNDSQTLSWPNIKVKFPSFDKPDVIIEAAYDISPDTLFEASTPYKVESVTAGDIVRELRKKLKMTQEELAVKSGTTKPYISKIENNKSGIEFSTFEKIIEDGFGGVMKIQIVFARGEQTEETFETNLGSAEIAFEGGIGSAEGANDSTGESGIGESNFARAV